MFNQKGQGSLEYLLLIGGAVLVAAIVIGLVVTSSQQAGGTISDATNNSAYCTSLTTYASCTEDITGSPTNAERCLPVDSDGGNAADAAAFSRCAAR